MAEEKSEIGATSVPTSPEHDFVITRVFDAPRALVFDAWTDSKQLAQWWGPRAFTTPVCELDARQGGVYHFVMRSPEGVEYSMRGSFQEVVKPERIVMTMDCTEHPAEWHDMVKPGRGKDEKNPAGIMVSTITFDEVDGKTKLTVRVRFESVEIAAAMLKLGMTEGWSMSLDRLDDLLAKA